MLAPSQSTLAMCSAVGGVMSFAGRMDMILFA
jgi:hypothetical protein